MLGIDHRRTRFSGQSRRFAGHEAEITSADPADTCEPARLTDDELHRVPLLSACIEPDIPPMKSPICTGGGASPKVVATIAAADFDAN
jgi:hypothetical protein